MTVKKAADAARGFVSIFFSFTWVLWATLSLVSGLWELSMKVIPAEKRA